VTELKYHQKSLYGDQEFDIYLNKFIQKCPVKFGPFLKNWKWRGKEFSSFLYIDMFLKAKMGLDTGTFPKMYQTRDQMSQLIDYYRWCQYMYLLCL